MKSNFKKILSILLTVALMLSCVVISGVSASTTTAKEYWVINGGTGDGRTVDTPAASVSAVIASINADNPTNAIVYIKQRSDYNYQTAGVHNTTYWSETGTEDITEYTASLTVKPYDTSITTYLVFSSLLGQNQQLRLGGNTIFEGLTLVSPRYTETAIAAKGYNLTFASDVKFGSYNSYDVPTNTTSAQFTISSRNALQFQTDAYNGEREVSEDCNILFNNAFITESSGTNTKTSVIIGGVHPQYVYKKDLNITFDNENLLAGVLVASNHPTSINTIGTVQGNINVNVKNASQVIFQATPACKLVANAFQVIVSNATVSGDVTEFTNVTLNNGAYYLYNQTGNENVLSFTDTAGVYTVNGDANISAVNKSTSETINVIDGTLTLTAGEWDIITRVADKSYYVKNGATGSGASYDDPAGSIAEVIEQMNADGLNAYNVADVYIIHNDNWNIVSDTSGTHGMAYWKPRGEATEVHNAKMVIKPYVTTETTYLAFSDMIGMNDTLIATGPVSFENIVLVEPRFKENAFILNGNDITFGEGVSFASYWAYSTPSTANSEYSLNNNAYWSILTGNSGVSAYSDDVNLTVASQYVSSTNSIGDICKGNIRIGNSGTTSATYSKDVNITINSLEAAPVINFGNGGSSGTTTINGNINLNLKASLGVTLAQANYYWNGSSNVEGDGNQLNANAFQAIITSGSISGDITELSKVSIANGCYYIYNKTGNADIIKFTETAGEYVVTDNTYVLTATNKDDGTVVESSGGVLNLEAGSWDLTAVKPSTTNYYYVQFGGTGNGKTVDTPAATVADVISTINTELGAGDVAYINIIRSANRTLNVNGAYGQIDGETVYLQHGYTAWSSDGSIPEHGAKIVVQAYDASETTYLAFGEYVGDNVNLNVGGETEFKNITLLALRNKWRNIEHKGNNVKYGVGTTYAYMPCDIYYSNQTYSGAINTSTNYSTYFGDKDTSATYNDDVEVIYENEYSSGGSDVNGSIFLGNPSRLNTYKGDLSVTFNNANSSPTIYNKGNTVIEGNLNINAKSANSILIYDDSGTLTVGGAIQVITGYGVGYTGDIVNMSSVTATGGVYIVNIKSNVANALTPTDEAGVFSVKSGYGAMAVNDETGEITRAVDNILTLEKNAKYSVYVSDSYINTGSSIEIFSSKTIDLANETHKEITDKLFIGWKKSNGNWAAQSETYSAGEVLTACYVDFSEDGFVIEEQQITTYNSNDVGLRFIVKQETSIDDLITERGILTLPTDTAGGRLLEKDTPVVIQYTWDSTENGTYNFNFTPSVTGATPEKVNVVNILEETETEKRYTLRLTDISDVYSTFYMARAYITYTDKNGVSKIMYSNDESASPYKAAAEATANGESHSVFNTIINAVKAENEAYRSSNDVQYTGSDTLVFNQSTTGYNRYATTSDTTGTLNNGMKKRISTINTTYNWDFRDLYDNDKITLKEQVKIGWLTDTHFNYIDQTDIDNKLVNALSTYRGRSWLRDGTGINWGLKTVNYCSKLYDTTVFTGDMVDYLSFGSLRATKHLIAEKSVNDSLLMTTGNHEFAEWCQNDIEGLVEFYSLGEKYGLLQDCWSHDVTYFEKIMKTSTGEDNIMLIMLDTGESSQNYPVGTADKLAASIAKAKQLKIPMLIFQHSPFNTYKADDAAILTADGGNTDIYPYGAPSNGKATNFCDGYGFYKKDEGKKVLDLIRKNYGYILGTFTGHYHNNIYTEIVTLDANGNERYVGSEAASGRYIPQFTQTAGAYGWVGEIVVNTPA